MARALRMLIEQLEQDRSLHEPHRLRQRIEALDRLDSYSMFAPVPAAEGDSAEALDLQHRASALVATLDALNGERYEAIRQAIRGGGGRDVLFEQVADFETDGLPAGLAEGQGYDPLDALVSGVLQLEEPAAETDVLTADMVFYQPTPARHIFDMFRRAALCASDVLIDLGSGLGHVPLLASICTGARCIGIEREPAYVDCARRGARALNLNVTFIRQDARAADLRAGTVFYLYTPFTGAVLRSVLDALRREAAQRAIRVCTLGPCSQVVAQEPWLAPTASPHTDRIRVFCSRARSAR